MTKKILLIAGILIIAGLAVFLIFSSNQEQAGTEDGGGFSIMNYLPFGRSDDLAPSDNLSGSQTGEDETLEPSAPYVNQPVPRLRKISSEPVAGAVIFNVGTSSAVRFVEKGTGNVYEARSDSVRVERLTNTTIPKIIRAFWLPDGSGFLAQTLLPESEIIETSFVRLNRTSQDTASEDLTPYNVTISQLPTGIKEITVRPDSARIFYYTVSGNSSWFVSNPDGTGATLVYTHPLTEWVPEWVSVNQIIVQTKVSRAAESFAFLFDVSNRTLRKTAATTETFAEKCAASPKSAQIVYCGEPSTSLISGWPDVWYKGLVSTEDSLVKKDLANDIFYNVSNLSRETGQKIDVMNLKVSPDETHLIFENKIDGFSWMLRIEE